MRQRVVLHGNEGKRSKEMTMRHEEFISLRDLVYEKSGIYFTDNKAYLLENRLRNRLSELNLSTFKDYYCYLQHGEKAAEELANLFDAVTTNETSFFRNPPQIELLKALLRSEHFNGARRSETLRVWSAGCSTGEEPYTIAVAILEEKEALSDTRPFKIVGTDISRKALNSAESAIFNSYALRHVDEAIRKKYFTRNKTSFAVNDLVKGCVKFKFMNLNDAPSYRRLGRMDIIFCRNVLIYFGENVKRKVAIHFYNALKPGGYLFLGHSEYLYPVSEALKPIVLRDTVVYQKGGE
jgi:chemotaxis protein methyltransferase CheR